MTAFVQVMSNFIHILYGVTQTIGFPSYALAIIILGIIVRILLLPLSIMQMKSTIGMSEIQPEIKELQTKYANNREKMSEEMAKLYKEYDVRPAAGCLPILIQMPILYALFRAMRQYNFSENASFLWIDSLNNTDALYIMPVLLAVVMFLQQKLSMPKGSEMANNPSMKVMLYFMPVMMGFFALQFPTGLCLYWITTSVIMVFQQIFMNRLRAKEVEERKIEREKRRVQREQELEKQAKMGQNPSKKKTKQQLKNEHKAKKRNSNYKAPTKEGSGATYKAPKK